MKKYEVYFDGACLNDGTKNNPMGIGVVFYENGVEVAAFSKRAKKNGSSNMAEWIACAFALQKFASWALPWLGDDDQVFVYGDSQLIVNQFNGLFKIKHWEFEGYYELAHQAVEQIGPNWSGMFHVRRHLNKRADELSKLALDKAKITK
jgi:ribonuclease HI